MDSSRSPFLFPVLVLGFSFVWASTPALSADAGKLPKLTISHNQRSLVTEEGKPFFYLADTAWDLFHRLKWEEVDLGVHSAGQSQPERLGGGPGRRDQKLRSAKSAQAGKLK